MRYRQLGNSNISVSEIGFGTMSLTGDAGSNTRILHRALELGINFFDTADLYEKGEIELLLGKAFKGRRKEIILATKVGNQWREDGTGWDWNPSKQYILTAVDKSLARLQTDYIDLYQLHGGTLEDPIDETIDAFESLVKMGKILHYGISSIRPNVIREYVKRSGIISVMMQYSLLDRRPEESCFSLLKDHQISVLARGTLAKGLLVNKTPSAYLNYSADQVKKMAASVHSHTPTGELAASTPIRWVLQHPVIASAIVGIRTMQQLEEAVRASETQLLTDAVMDELNAALAPNQYDQHR